MKYKYIMKGMLELLLNPGKITKQPGILLERLVFGLKKTIKHHTYKVEEGTTYINLYDMKFAIGNNIHVYTEILNELYPFLTAEIIDSIIPENSYLDYSQGIIIHEGDYVIDAGASLGFFSIAAAKKAGKSGRVLAFEPVELCRELLSKSVMENELKNLELYDCALGQKNETLYYDIDKKGFGTGSRVTSVKKIKGENIKVNVTTIDSIVKKNRVKKIDFIKMDIEGHERFALLGAKNTIKKYRPKLSICTYHLPDDPEVIKNIILSINPQYKIIQKSHKILAV